MYNKICETLRKMHNGPGITRLETAIILIRFRHRGSRTRVDTARRRASFLQSKARPPYTLAWKVPRAPWPSKAQWWAQPMGPI